MEDNEILELYFARNEKAIVQTGQKYGNYCFQIANHILSCREDSEETVNDTFLRAWNVIPPQRPDYLRLFLGKITRNLAFARWRKYSAVKRGGGQMDLVLEELSDCIAGPERVDDRLNLKELSNTIGCFLETVTAREKDIFLLRYFYAQDSKMIAKRFGLRSTNVNMILSRTRSKLKVFLFEEGYVL